MSFASGCGGKAVPPRSRLQPHCRNACLLGTALVWACTRFVRHYYGSSSRFLRLREMFQLAWCPPPEGGADPQVGGLPHSDIAGSRCARHSPAHFAAMPRPSSAQNAWASPVCSFCLLCTHVHGWRKSVAPALPAVRGVLRRAMNMICRFSYAMQLVRYCAFCTLKYDDRCRFLSTRVWDCAVRRGSLERR